MFGERCSPFAFNDLEGKNSVAISTGDGMERDKIGSRDRILAAATKEFLEYGFKDASLRRIASSVGMTVSALYKHFSNKEDIFSAIVEPTYREFLELYAREETAQFANIEKYGAEKIFDSSKDSEFVVNYVYDNIDAFKLIVCKSAGTRYENFVHEIASREEETTLRYIKLARKHSNGIKTRINKRELHLLVSVNAEAVFETIRHDFSRKDAIHYARTLDEFFTAAWKKYFGFN